MTNKTFALLALGIMLVISAIAYAMRPEPIIAQGGTYLPRDPLISMTE